MTASFIVLFPSLRLFPNYGYLLFLIVVLHLFCLLGDTFMAASAKDLWGGAVRIEASVRCV